MNSYHDDEDYGMASEMANCLTEAQIAAASHSVRCRVVGDAAARWVATLSYPYYCRSTDAFAGMVACVKSYGATRLEALAGLPEVAEEDDEASINVQDRG